VNSIIVEDFQTSEIKQITLNLLENKKLKVETFYFVLKVSQTSLGFPIVFVHIIGDPSLLGDRNAASLAICYT
jgi:hypothetical protein